MSASSSTLTQDVRELRWEVALLLAKVASMENKIEQLNRAPAVLDDLELPYIAPAAAAAGFNPDQAYMVEVEDPYGELEEGEEPPCAQRRGFWRTIRIDPKEMGRPLRSSEFAGASRFWPAAEDDDEAEAEDDASAAAEMDAEEAVAAAESLI